jgi:CheY-like chemotaxis protein
VAKRKIQNSESKKKILIIDDEPDIVVYLTTLLEDQNFTVVSASDGQQGLELIRKERPDLVCLDIMMPRKTGVALYQEVKMDPELKTIPCIIISAYESAYTFKGQAFRRLVQNRAIPEPLRFFEKPLDIPAFLDFINGLFRKAGKK